MDSRMYEIYCQRLKEATKIEIEAICTEKNAILFKSVMFLIDNEK